MRAHIRYGVDRILEAMQASRWENGWRAAQIQRPQHGQWEIAPGDRSGSLRFFMRLSETAYLPAHGSESGLISRLGVPVAFPAAARHAGSPNRRSRRGRKRWTGVGVHPGRRRHEPAIAEYMPRRHAIDEKRPCVPVRLYACAASSGLPRGRVHDRSDGPQW